MPFPKTKNQRREKIAKILNFKKNEDHGLHWWLYWINRGDDHPEIKLADTHKVRNTLELARIFKYLKSKEYKMEKRSYSIRKDGEFFVKIFYKWIGK